MMKLTIPHMTMPRRTPSNSVLSSHRRLITFPENVTILTFLHDQMAVLVVLGTKACLTYYFCKKPKLELIEASIVNKLMVI